MIARMSTPTDALAQAAKDLVGMELSHIWPGHGTALFLEFGKLSERLRKSGSVGNHPIGEISVGLEFEWRIEVDRRLACGSSGDQELWPEVFKDLLGKCASRVKLFGDVPELRVVAGERARLLTFSLDESGPAWALTDNRSNPSAWIYWKDGELRCDEGKVTA
jgi:hypothetical protein